MLPTLESPELIFGLCSPIGTDNSRVTTLITNALAKYRYGCVPYKVTKLMTSFVIPGQEISDHPAEARYTTRINYANKLRELFDDHTILATMCCGAVRQHRRKNNGAPTKYIPRTCYLFDQFKRKEEIDALRQIYGRLFVLVSVYSDKEVRTARLTERIAEAVARPAEEHATAAKSLVARDDHEEGVKYGQRVREAFPLGDIFINIDDLAGAEKALDRFLRAFFGAVTVSPTRDEYGMYLARNAALRSLDLSRQVGAAVVSRSGEVITLGCNEVPKSGGGTYWSGDAAEPDDRDYKREHDENDRIKRALLADVVRRLLKSESVKADKSIDELVEVVLVEASKKESLLREAELMDLLEFGRIIHAEMCALCDAARLGKSVKDATLYCTTFPCHICAKHIVASGIMRVLFIEPFPKSYAEQLHGDSIVVRTGPPDGKKVQFEPFIGISPFRYRDLFERGRRKDAQGKLIEWKEETANPIVKLTVATYIQNETATIDILHRSAQKLAKAGAITFGGADAAEPLIELPELDKEQDAGRAAKN
jgi:cytidine deaminase